MARATFSSRELANSPAQERTGRWDRSQATPGTQIGSKIRYYEFTEMRGRLGKRKLWRKIMSFKWLKSCVSRLTKTAKTEYGIPCPLFSSAGVMQHYNRYKYWTNQNLDVLRSKIWWKLKNRKAWFSKWNPKPRIGRRDTKLKVWFQAELEKLKNINPRLNKMSGSQLHYQSLRK